ncbi:MAG: NAD-dependent epimerase/dehydratase family protein [Acidimicrobiia bacterium]|nr:NAD-dependent epimerase/dehydratase family protein [Acidimicrobiia bacterium]
MKPILITGATGFLGKHLIDQLKREGEGPVRVLCRGAPVWDEDPAIEVVRGDITSPDDVDRAMAGTRAVYHLAGIVSRDPKDNILLYRVHVGGTRNVCEAAKKHQPERVVVASSSGTIAVSHEPVIHDETAGYKHEVVGHWAYYLSKIYAEKAALEYFQRDKLPIVVVNPALLLGPGDGRNSSTGDLAMFLDGQIMSMPLGGMSFVDARDCAAGVIGAMRRGRLGERYLLGGPNWTFRRIVNHVAEISGLRPPILEISVGASLAMAPLLRRVMPLVGRKFELDDATIKMSSMFWHCSSAKAESELGFRIRDPLETLRATVEDLRARRAA